MTQTTDPKSAEARFDAARAPQIDDADVEIDGAALGVVGVSSQRAVDCDARGHPEIRSQLG
jgi:hypothetical protein